jgi:hypothetical protein
MASGAPAASPDIGTSDFPWKILKLMLNRSMAKKPFGLKALGRWI